MEEGTHYRRLIWHQRAKRVTASLRLSPIRLNNQVLNEGVQDEKADDHLIRVGPADVRSRCSLIRSAAAGHRQI